MYHSFAVALQTRGRGREASEVRDREERSGAEVAQSGRRPGCSGGHQPETKQREEATRRETGPTVAETHRRRGKGQAADQTAQQERCLHQRARRKGLQGGEGIAFASYTLMSDLKYCMRLKYNRGLL